MYTLIIDFGIVKRNSDGKVVSPAQSVEDPDFIEYQHWVNVLGNSPVSIYSDQIQQPQPEVIVPEIGRAHV